MDLREHRRHEGAAEVDGPVARLEPRAGELRSQLLPPSAEDVPRLLEGGPGLPQGGLGQLGSRRQHRAGQRAGDRRQGLAHRRAGRAAQAHAMEPQDHALRRRAAGASGHARPLAREGAPDAGQLDRQEPRRARLLAADRRLGREIAASSRSSRRGPTRCMARRSRPCRPSIRWSPSWPRTIPACSASSPNAARPARRRPRSRPPRRSATSCRCWPSIR